VLGNGKNKKDKPKKQKPNNDFIELQEAYAMSILDTKDAQEKLKKEKAEQTIAASIPAFKKAVEHEEKRMNDARHNFWRFIREEHDLLSLILTTRLQNPKKLKTLTLSAMNILQLLFYSGFFGVLMETSRSNFSDYDNLRFSLGNNSFSKALVSCLMALPIYCLVYIFIRGMMGFSTMSEKQFARVMCYSKILEIIGYSLAFTIIILISYASISMSAEIPENYQADWGIIFGISLGIQVILISTLKVIFIFGLHAILLMFTKIHIPIISTIFEPLCGFILFTLIYGHC